MAKKNEIQDIKSASREDLLKMAKELQDKLQAMKFDHVAGKIKNVNEIHIAKKNIARVQTQITVLAATTNS